MLNKSKIFHCILRGFVVDVYQLSTMEKISFAELNYKNIVVLEFGRHYTRCGFAGEPAPRAIIRTCLTNRENGKKIYLHSIRDAAELRRSLGDYIEKIYFNYLAVSPKEKKVVIVESVFLKSLFRNTLTRVFFDQFNVPSILFVPDHLMALATLGRSTGLVVDIGAEEAISIAVVEGVTLLNGAQLASLGARTLDLVIADELLRQNPSLKDRLKPETLEDIRLKACFVAPFERGCQMAKNKLKDQETSIKNMHDCYIISKQDDNSPAAVEYSLDGQKTINIPGNLREGTCEILFELFGHEQSLTTIIIETILSAPIDCRRSLAENILVIGGLANLPGLVHRLSRELEQIDKYGRLPNLRFHKPICPKNYVSWLGASMFCTSSSMELRSTTREQWIKDGRKNLRDWSDLALRI